MALVTDIWESSVAAAEVNNVPFYPILGNVHSGLLPLCTGSDRRFGMMVLDEVGGVQLWWETAAAVSPNKPFCQPSVVALHNLQAPDV